MSNNGTYAELEARYARALEEYVLTHSEAALFNISKLSKEFMMANIGPADVTNMHAAAMGKIVGKLSGDAAVNAFHSSTEPLLEIMMNYAMTYHMNREKPPDIPLPRIRRAQGR